MMNKPKSGIYRSASGAAAVSSMYSAFLRHWPVPNEQRHVATRLGDTYVITCGPADAPTLVLLHGAGFNSVTWMGDVTTWSQHFRVVALDVIGHPGFSAPVRPAYDSDSYASWLDDVLHALGIERASLIGLSLGGWIALDYAIRRPERVERLILLAPAGVAREKMSMLKIIFVILPLTMLGHWGRQRAQRLMLGEYREPSSVAEKAVAEFYALISKNFRQNLSKPMRFSDSQLASIKPTTLLLVGAKDPWMDAAEIQHRFNALVPRAQVQILAEKGHMLVGLTQPILQFLRGDA
jgi:pimeloyl-ACP methyl ester carboxylesterase